MSESEDNRKPQRDRFNALPDSPEKADILARSDATPILKATFVSRLDLPPRINLRMVLSPLKKLRGWWTAQIDVMPKPGGRNYARGRPRRPCRRRGSRAGGRSFRLVRVGLTGVGARIGRSPGRRRGRGKGGQKPVLLGARVAATPTTLPAKDFHLRSRRMLACQIVFRAVACNSACAI